MGGSSAKAEPVGTFEPTFDSVQDSATQGEMTKAAAGYFRISAWTASRAEQSAHDAESLATMASKAAEEGRLAIEKMRLHPDIADTHNAPPLVHQSLLEVEHRRGLDFL
mmetsp:Transcript_14940/g.24633  ORF Transcript_14940/g.24633 Transcript_14940/m.24633 type:complete len:109 (+) Transcript_14940:76-402(+)